MLFPAYMVDQRLPKLLTQVDVGLLLLIQLHYQVNKQAVFCKKTLDAFRGHRQWWQKALLIFEVRKNFRKPCLAEVAHCRNCVVPGVPF